MKLPTEPHPATGEPFVDGDVSIKRESQVVHCIPRSKPTRTVETAWDDDGWATETRERSDDEMAEALAAWEKVKDVTMVRVPGPATTSGTFRTASGATASGVLRDDGVWVLLEWRARPGQRRH